MEDGLTQHPLPLVLKQPARRQGAEGEHASRRLAAGARHCSPNCPPACLHSRGRGPPPSGAPPSLTAGCPRTAGRAWIPQRLSRAGSEEARPEASLPEMSPATLGQHPVSCQSVGMPGHVLFTPLYLHHRVEAGLVEARLKVPQAQPGSAHTHALDSYAAGQEKPGRGKGLASELQSCARGLMADDGAGRRRC